MAAPKREVIYFQPDLHKALRLKATHTEKSISDLVNVAVRRSLAEDVAQKVDLEQRGAARR